MAVQYVFVNSENSSSTSGPKDLLKTISSDTRSSIYSGMKFIRIKKRFLISQPKKARVLQSFDIKVEPVEGGFLATSNISDIYELGETMSQAARNYLYSLVDEIIWFHDNKHRLSPTMLEDLGKLRFYLKLV